MLNKVQLIGYVGADPKTLSFHTGTKVSKFRLAINEKIESMGVLETETVWHSIQCWNKTAEYVEKHIRKGDKIYVEGKLCYDNYTDKNNTERSITYISVSKVIQLTKKGGEDPTTPPPNNERLYHHLEQ